MKSLEKLNRSEFVLRMFDIVFSFFLILLFSPLMFFVAFCVKISDLKSPVFADNHMRVGKNGKLFFMYKFRTMIPNAHEFEKKDPVFAKLNSVEHAKGSKLRIKDDVRITKVGAIVRRLDMDELPQLFNVLKGNMSLVGPRAYFAEEIEEYSNAFDVFKEKIGVVLKVKPGITGLWQISGRNLLSIQKRIELDYEYVGKRGIISYILILLKTPYVVLTRYGVCE